MTDVILDAALTGASDKKGLIPVDQVPPLVDKKGAVQKQKILSEHHPKTESTNVMLSESEKPSFNADDLDTDRNQDQDHDHDRDHYLDQDHAHTFNHFDYQSELKRDHSLVEMTPLFASTECEFSLPKTSIVDLLSDNILLRICEYVSQYDLCNLRRTCTHFHAPATERLYRNITVTINPCVPSKYQNDVTAFARDNAIQYYNSSLIMKIPNLHKFVNVVKKNISLFRYIRYFRFGKCYGFEDNSQPVVDWATIERYSRFDLIELQWTTFNVFAENATSTELDFSFIDYVEGKHKMKEYMSKESVRRSITTMSASSEAELNTPFIPSTLNTLAYCLPIDELLCVDNIDCSTEPYTLLNSVSTFKCFTLHCYGLDLVRRIKIANNTPLGLKSFTTSHYHNEKTEINNKYDLPSAEFKRRLKTMQKTLSFGILSAKLDLTTLTEMRLYLTCLQIASSSCTCYGDFYNDFAIYAMLHQGLPNLIKFDALAHEEHDWLRPHHFRNSVLNPLGNFILTLSNMQHLTVDFGILGFKMFDENSDLSYESLNRLSEDLMKLFFSKFVKNGSKLKTLQMDDFLMAFIYFQPLFYKSLLHTCKCEGCDRVLGLVARLYSPNLLEDIPKVLRDTLLVSTYYMACGYILGKLKNDREIHIPMKSKTIELDKYSIYNGQSNTLHNGFHDKDDDDAYSFEFDPFESDEDVFEQNLARFVNKTCKCSTLGEEIDEWMTTYLIHQLEPVLHFLHDMFGNLEALKLHGLYFTYNNEKKQFEPIFDSATYSHQLFENPRFLDPVTSESFGHYSIVYEPA